jgi:pyruvate dehydrogenase E1 component beta subunit
VARIGIIKAMQLALDYELEHDPRVIVMGEDVVLGVWGYTRGLAAKYGEKRVRNTPISEIAFTGAGAGAAMTGLRPVVDLMVSNFIYTAFDQIANHIAKLPYMTDGRLRIPLTMVAATGSAGSNAAQHSDLPTALLVNLGAIKVVLPSTPEDAAGLLTAAMRDDGPVIFLYPASLGSHQGEEFAVGVPLPFGVARVRRAGTDVTVWAPGLMAWRAMQAAPILAERGISIEVIDPRSLAPLDVETVFQSVAKTRHLVALDEGRGPCSTASEIIAQMAMRGLDLLRRPPIRVTAPADVPVPYAPLLEREVVPRTDHIVDACRAVVGETLARTR